MLPLHALQKVIGAKRVDDSLKAEVSQGNSSTGMIDEEKTIRSGRQL